ncbi:ATP-binding protein [Haloferula chungangensis]|uniref:histidine kinase n=1 Tax=Haloferula chungangensis TaxID=1048331 RepID=A0ABW2L5S2_9BACT
MPSLVLCAHRDPSVPERLRASFATSVPGMIDVEAFTNGAELANRAGAVLAEKRDLPLIFAGIDLDELDGIELLRQLHHVPPLRDCRKVLLAEADDTGDSDTLLQLGALHGRLDPEFDEEALRRLMKSLLTDYVVHSAPHLLHELHPLLDLRSLASGFSSTRKNYQQLNSKLNEVKRSVIAVDELSDDQIEASMIDEFDKVLGHPDRKHYAPGDVLVNEGDEAGTIWIIIEGRVKLYRTIDGDDVTFHSESAGRIVGLMSLSLQSPVFFSCRAVTPTTALVLGSEQVREAIHQSPSLSNYLITVILRSMARRNRRSAQLLVQVRTLNHRLAEQRDELAETLDELRATQERLVETTKMATLGNLAAGMAHELNNPIGAILHATEHLEQDLERLLGMTPDLAVAAAAIPVAKKIPPRSTRDERRLRDALAKDLKVDPNKAARLVAAGVECRADFQRYRALAGGIGDEQVLRQLDLAGQIGMSLRNCSNCSSRVAALVRSLKIYARSDEDHFEKVELNGTIDDVLLILANRLREIDLEKHYAELPEILASPSQLQQVWTNLISNASQAIGPGGTVKVSTCSPRPGWQRVEVEDNGVGIREEDRERLFEARFTTRKGRVEFGLGLGLPISRNIVLQHGGEIRFESQPGRTVFTVDLPENPPKISQPPEAL